MTDRRAAEIAGLNPDTAAYTKSKPRVRAYMLEHRAAVQRAACRRRMPTCPGLPPPWPCQRKTAPAQPDPRPVLDRLWEIADLDAEKTRGNMSSQVKALSMIAAIEGLIPVAAPPPRQNKPAHSTRHRGYLPGRLAEEAAGAGAQRAGSRSRAPICSRLGRPAASSFANG